MSRGVEYVLDASALIALAAGEPGADRVAELLGSSAISAVNLAEAVSKLIQKGGDRNTVERLLRGLELKVVAWDEDQAYAAAEFAPLARKRGLSLGDRACITLAAALNATAVTTERGWSGLARAVLRIR